MQIKPVLWMLAAAFQVAASLAQATTVSVSVGGAIPLQGVSESSRPQVQAGTTKLTWSNGQVDPNVPYPSVTGVGGSLNASNTLEIVTTGTGHHEEYKTYAGGARKMRVLEYDEYPVQSIQMDDFTGQFQSLALNGGSQKIAPFLSGAVTGGVITATNVRIDLVGGRVIMDLVGNRDPYINEFDQNVDEAPVAALGVTVYTFDPAAVEGPKRLTPQDIQLTGTNRDTALQAQGFTLGVNGEIQAVNLIKRLEITAEAKQFAIDHLGFSATVVTAMDSIDDADPNGWGWLKVTSNFVLPVPSTAQLQSGQTATTPFTLSSGLPLRVKYLSTAANMTLAPLNYNNASPAYSQLGLLPWLNLAGVAPQDFPQGNGLPDSSNYTTAVQDPYFDSFDDRGYSRVGMAFAIAGTSISLDKQTGSVISVGGFRQDWASDAVNSFTLAGRWSARNINYTLTEKLAVADLSGSVQVAPGQIEAIPAQPATPAFAFSSVTGPVQLPLQALSQAATVTDMTTVLKNAGFRGVVATATDITFSARYVFSGVSITEAYKSFMCQALRCTPLAQKALGGQDTDYFGGLTANVKFSLPLTP